MKYAPGITAAEKANFITIINNINATTTGIKMIAALDAYYKANPTFNTITVTDATPIEFNPNNQTLNLGDLLQSGNFDSSNAYQTGHEMYHAYEQTQGQSPLYSNFELDAYIFGAEVAKEMPDDQANANYETDPEVKSPTTPAQINFNNAWDNFLNGNISASNYAVLDNDFLTGSKFGPEYTTYNTTTNGVKTAHTVTNNPNSTPLFLK